MAVHLEQAEPSHLYTETRGISFSIAIERHGGITGGKTVRVTGAIVSGRGAPDMQWSAPTVAFSTGIEPFSLEEFAGVAKAVADAFARFFDLYPQATLVVDKSEVIDPPRVEQHSSRQDAHRGKAYEDHVANHTPGNKDPRCAFCKEHTPRWKAEKGG